jgi:predicted RNA-binding Zn-ribbon protein involved in translation (DUF1610 family)
MVVVSGRKTADKMICPRCGAKMNHHCDKLVYSGRPLPHDASEIDTTEIEPLSRGLITEFHACPNCGAAASRNAGSS